MTHFPFSLSTMQILENFVMVTEARKQIRVSLEVSRGMESDSDRKCFVLCGKKSDVGGAWSYPDVWPENLLVLTPQQLGELFHTSPIREEELHPWNGLLYHQESWWRSRLQPVPFLWLFSGFVFLFHSSRRMKSKISDEICSRRPGMAQLNITKHVGPTQLEHEEKQRL